MRCLRNMKKCEVVNRQKHLVRQQKGEEKMKAKLNEQFVECEGVE